MSPTEIARTQRILIVDDEANLASTLKAGLSRLLKCQVVSATSGQEALQILEQQPFDLLITDYKMPGMDGVALAARVREQYPRTVIMMVTAYGDEQVLKQAARLAIRRVLDKPVRLPDVYSAALEVLGGSGLAKRS